tara:strand:- start:2179 stop:3150 length:972 start_codon:yes stop_codon:yes gene_type:complete
MKLTHNKFSKIINKKFIFEKNPSFAVAVSGGPDSMCLLFLLINWNNYIKGKLTVLIINHNVRSDSLKEAKSISIVLKNKNIKSKILSVKRNKVIKKNMNEARINRYSLLTNYCRNNNILHLFVAHHKDDNLETFLYRKVSGSDFDGLLSIKEISLINKINILRPLLEFTKEEILVFNKVNEIPFVKDPTNLNKKYTRPSIRDFLNKTNVQNLNAINKEFLKIKNYSKKYKMITSINLIENIIDINKKKITVNYNKIIMLDILLLEKLIKNIYQFLNGISSNIRSKKIQILITKLNLEYFKFFNLGNILVRKVDENLIFFKKTN